MRHGGYSHAPQLRGAVGGIHPLTSSLPQHSTFDIQAPTLLQVIVLLRQFVRLYDFMAVKEASLL